MLQFVTNGLNNATLPYLIVLRARDQVILLDEVILAPLSSRYYNISASKINIANGGVVTMSVYALTSQLFKFVINPPYVQVFSNVTNATSQVLLNASFANYTQWIVPKGEALFFKRPVDTLYLKIITNKQVYN